VPLDWPASLDEPAVRDEPALVDKTPFEGPAMIDLPLLRQAGHALGGDSGDFEDLARL